jgi:hypothetical protein
LLLVFLVTTAAWGTYIPFDAEKTQWKTGQVLALSQQLYDPTTFIFEVGTGSRYGHVGLVVVEKAGVFVLEESPPHAKKTPVDIFLKTSLAKGVHQATLLEPIHDLTPDETNKIVTEGMRIVDLQLPYNFSMVMNKESMNCSEFVHHLFEYIGLAKVGLPEPFKNMNVGAFKGQLLALARINPDKTGDSVSPAAIVNSSELRVISANLPVETILSEFEVLTAWKDSGALKGILDIFGLPEQVGISLFQIADHNAFRPYPTTWRSPALKCTQAISER